MRMTSIARLPNFATLASVPASVTVLVMTLCAWRLYSGTMRRWIAEEEVDEDAVVAAVDVVDTEDATDANELTEPIAPAPLE
jgi:hypothetical protein